MNHVLTLSAVALLLAASAPVQASTGGEGSLSPSAKSSGAVKDARSKCRDDAKTQGLKGDARREAVKTCFARAMPHEAAALKCRQEGHEKGLSGSEFRSFTKQCRASAV